MQSHLEALRRVTQAREPGHHGTCRLAELAPALREAHPGLRLDFAGDDIAIPLSPEGLAIVLGHLLANAAQHGATRVELTAGQAGGHAVLTVADNGPGISTGNRSRIFAPFFTTRREKGGTGMGLTITANLLAAHGASIALMPTDHGATFALSFEAPPVP